jgi:hypothetical protein
MVRDQEPGTCSLAAAKSTRRQSIDNQQRAGGGAIQQHIEYKQYETKFRLLQRAGVWRQPIAATPLARPVYTPSQGRPGPDREGTATFADSRRDVVDIGSSTRLALVYFLRPGKSRSVCMDVEVRN